jgi:hypothetical protein
MNLLRVTVIVLLSGVADGVEIHSPSTFDADSEGWEPWSAVTPGGQTNSGGLAPGDGNYVIAADGVGQYGKMITYHAGGVWTGDYQSAGVTGIVMHIENRSTTDDVHLRVTLSNRTSPMEVGGTWWLAKTAIVVSNGQDWSLAQLPIDAASFQKVGNFDGLLGPDTFAQVMGDVRSIRILSAAVLLGPFGDTFDGDVALDNITLLGVSRPTGSVLQIR